VNLRQERERFNARLVAIRRDGSRAFRAGDPKNPYEADTLSAYIWHAGYSQDTRSIDELHVDWLLTTRRKTQRQSTNSQRR
jgi:hypothetical protein